MCVVTFACKDVLFVTQIKGSLDYGCVGWGCVGWGCVLMVSDCYGAGGVAWAKGQASTPKCALTFSLSFENNFGISFLKTFAQVVCI